MKPTLKLILTDRGHKAASSIKSHSISWDCVSQCFFPPCQAVLTCPYLTHRWLRANTDRLLEGKLATIWNITGCQKQPQPAHTHNLHLLTIVCGPASIFLKQSYLLFIHAGEVQLKSN